MTPSYADTAGKDVPEALAGAHAGQVLSLVKVIVPGAEVVPENRRRNPLRREGEEQWGLAWSTTLSMRGSTLRENRETLRPPTEDGGVGRDGKSEDWSHSMNGAGSLTAESYRRSPRTKGGGSGSRELWRT